MDSSRLKPALFKVKPANEMIHAGCVHAVLATTVAV